jgi:RNA polymerase sigma-70 factor (sigma-E family)
MGRDQREAAYVEFVAARQAHFRRIAYALCGDWAQADDLLQVALVKLYVAWPRVKRDGREEAYVRKILVRANIDEARRPWHREHPVETLPDRADSPTPDTDHGLPLMQRRTVVLRHWLGLSVEETAAELGVATGTVKTHSARALERLQVALTKEGS